MEDEDIMFLVDSSVLFFLSIIRNQQKGKKKKRKQIYCFQLPEWLADGSSGSINVT